MAKKKKITKHDPETWKNLFPALKAMTPKKSTKPKKSVDVASKFYRSYEWRNMRYIVLKKYEGKCMLCHCSNLPLQVDHIKPLRKHWALRLDITNLQVLCEKCNHGKGNWDETDWRP
jgi:HNH endonuclease